MTFNFIEEASFRDSENSLLLSISYTFPMKHVGPISFTWSMKKNGSLPSPYMNYHKF